MLLRGIVLIFAIVFILIGLLGFISPIISSSHHLLFNFFTISILLNLFYILVGLIALSASSATFYSRLYFKFFGIIFGALAIWSFAMNGNLEVMHINIFDSFFYLLAAIIALYLGFTSKLPRSYAH